MKLRIASVAACALLATPVLAQSEEEPQVDLEAIDALLGGSMVTESDDDGDAAEGDAAIADGDDDGPGGDEGADEDAPGPGEAEAADDGDAAEEEGEEAVDEDGEAELSDLTRAFNAYSLCASEAGAELEGDGFAVDQIGPEALLRCAGHRAAYVNAFYFDLLPRYADSTEADVRASAERLVAQSDAALMNIVTAEVRDLRRVREAEAAAEETDPPADETEDEETETDA